jgi:small subunit ribosomal protein S6
LERIYEGMYLIDNAVVREGWDKAKSIVTGTLAKHGANVLSARRWDERRLAYPIKGRNRATFLLTYYHIAPDAIPAMRRDFELNESVLRSLEITVEAVPAGEAELVAAEATPEFRVPTPPDDDHVEFVAEPEDEGRPRRRNEARDDSSSDDDDDSSTEDSQETVSASEEN